MLKILNLLLCLVLVGAFTACKSDEEQAQDEASVLVDEQNSIVSRLRTMGTPRASWSESRLNEYENLIDSLESVESRLGSLNGTNGITIYGNNETTIPVMRSVLAAARARRTAGTVSTITVPTVPTFGFGDGTTDVDEDEDETFFENDELSERADALATEVSSFKSDYPHYLLMDYDAFSFEELLAAQEAVAEHLAVVEEYNSVLEERLSESRRRINSMDYGSPARSVSEAMGFALMVDQMSVSSDLTTANLALSVIEREIEEARADGRAEEYLMNQPVAQ